MNRLLLLVLAACGPSTFTSDPAPVSDDALDMQVADVVREPDAQTDASPEPDACPGDATAPNVCHIIYASEPTSITCGGNSPFMWESTIDGGQKMLVSCAMQACPYAAKCYVQGIAGNGVCAP